MSEIQNHSAMETLNSLYPSDRACRAATSSLVFSQFPSLPPELRLRIWNLCLERTRLVTITLRDVARTNKFKAKKEAPYSEKNELGKLISGGAYLIILRDRPFFSPLLRACSESRQVALSYYHIRIPLAPLRKRESPQLYLNADHDYLYIESFKIGVLLDHLLGDLLSYDQHDMGLRHLALCSEVAAEKLGSLNPPTPSTDEGTSSSTTTTAVTCFKEALQNLQTLWLVHLLGDFTRIMAGPLSGIPGNYQLGLNRSVPIFPRASRFMLLGPDPRPIEQDMKKLTVMRNPRMAALAWEDMEERYGLGPRAQSLAQAAQAENEVKEAANAAVSSHPPQDVSYVVSVGAVDDDTTSYRAGVRGPKSLSVYLAKEEERWEDLEEMLTKERGKGPVSQVPTAAGFWLFPADTFHSLPIGVGGKNSIHMEGRRPTLGLFTF